MSFFDSIGTIFEGGLFARAVEPKAGETAPEEQWRGTCLNCGTERVGPHCHACGQSAHIHRTMAAFMHDLLHGALHFEGKTWRTLPLLAFRPGQLTRRYIDGERARFVSPMALFLFSVFLMFAVFQLAGITPPTDLGPPVQVGENMSAEDARQQLESLKAARAEMGDVPGVSSIESQIDRLEAQLEAAAEREAEAGGESATAADGATETTGGEPEKIVLAESDSQDFRLTGGRTGVAFLDHGIEKWEKNPSLMAYKMQSNSYKFSWLLIPLSLPFVWLLFLWRRRFGLYDHAVFVTYSLSFMTLFYVALVLLGGLGVGTGMLMTAGTFVPLVHIYKQLKGAYSLSRFSALWRTVMLTVFIFVILVLFLNTLLVLGAVG